MYRNVCQVLCNTCKSNGLLVRRPLTTNAYNYGLFSVISQKIANSLVVNSAKDQLILWHEWTGMSWSAEIALVTIAIRALITFPLTVGQHKILAKYDALRPELIQFGQRLKKEVDSAQYLYNWSPIKAKLMYNLRMKQETKRLIIRDNCHPMKGSIVVWVQIPVWVILSHAIRNMSFMYPIADHNSQLIHSQLSTEGILWFSNLTLSDPYLVLPFLTAVVNLTIVQLHSNERLRKMETKTKMHAILTNAARGLSVALIPIGLVMPASVCWYWFVSSTMGLCQTWVLHSKAFRQHIGIQSTHTNN